MNFAAKILSLILCASLFLCAVAHAQCAVMTVTVKGQVEHAPRDARVRVQLVYPKDQPGESGDTTVEDGSFSVPLDFLTESRRPLLSNLRTKCDRKPKMVTVTLTAGDHEYDSVSLDFAKDFKMADRASFVLQSDLALTGLR
jgi:hypothetical protein